MLEINQLQKTSNCSAALFLLNYFMKQMIHYTFKGYSVRSEEYWNRNYRNKKGIMLMTFEFLKNIIIIYFLFSYWTKMSLCSCANKELQNGIEFTLNYTYIAESFSLDPQLLWWPILGSEMGGVTAGIGRSIDCKQKTPYSLLQQNGFSQEKFFKNWIFFRLFDPSNPQHILWNA